MSCDTWPLDTTCITGWPDKPADWTPEQQRAARLASETLWRLTAGRYGLCEETVRPCDPRHSGGGTHGTVTRPMAVTWEPDDGDLLAVRIVATGATHMSMDLGDGSPRRTVGDSQPVIHTYTRPGTFTVSVVDSTLPNRVAATVVTVKTALPTVRLFRHPDDPWRVLTWVDEDDQELYQVDWGDGTPPTTTRGTRTKDPPPHPRVSHGYTRPGTYTVTVTDTATRRLTRRDVDVGGIGVIFTFPASNDQPRMHAHWLAAGARCRITWGDGQPDQYCTVPPTGEVATYHPAAMEPGEYRVGVAELFGGGVRRDATRTLTVPSIWEWELDVRFAWRRRDNLAADTQDVTVHPTDARGDCTVDWGDGTPAETIPHGQSLTHLYRLPAPTAGYLLRITEVGVDDPHRFTRLLGEPRYVGHPIMHARTSGAVDLPVAGIDDNRNADWYDVTWDPRTHDPIGAVGRWYVARHIYSSPGTYTIAVDAPCMRTPIHRDATVAGYPSPHLSVAYDDDPMVVHATVNNAVSGGPVELRWGDGAVEEVDDGATVNHLYTTDGTYTIIATSLADRTARGQATITVPSAPDTTLKARVALDPDDPTHMTVRLTVVRYDQVKLPIIIDWGDDSDPHQLDAVTGPVPHTYAEAGDKSIVVGYTDGSESVYLDPITVGGAR